ncbi:amino acid adenylation domain-containing protein [Nocardia sp. NPDC049190]|uniref:amino acid adenylation domain-containing protein n=1 Tax=Nocardia sp. NPDC049190 TaxID=3155650 RepID=UPI003406836D
MRPEELLRRLRDAGVELWIDEPGLRFRAPRGALTPELKTALAAAKSEIMTLLAAADTLIREPEHRYEPFPLTEVQASYLLGRTRAFRWGGVGCHGYAEFAVRPQRGTRSPDAQRFRDAWRKVIARHEMLRCVVYPDGYQRIAPLGDAPMPPGLTVHTCATAAEMTELRTDIGRTLAHRGYEPGIGPMFDLVVTLGPEDTVVHFSIDLLIADFVGIAVVVRDLERCLRDPDIDLPPVEFGFRDYVLNLTRATHAPAERARRDRDRQYWFSRLDTLPPAIGMPLLPDADSAPARFARRSLRLSTDEWSAFTRAAAEHGVTPTAALLTAFGRVLGRYGDRDHFLLTLTTMNRRRITEAVDELVGDFTGTSLLEVDVRGEVPFAALAARVGERLFDDMDHARVSGVEVLRELARRDDNRGQQSPVVFTSTLGAAARDGGEALLVPVSGRGLSQTPQVLLDCQVTETVAGVDVNWDTRAGAIPDAVLDRAFADFDTILRVLSSDTAAWERQLLPPVPPPLTSVGPLSTDLLHSGFLRNAAERPEAVAIRRGDRAITYAELLAAATAVAAELSASGVGPRDLVGVRLEAGPEQIAALFGTLLAGAGYVPLDVRWPDARVAQIVQQCGSAVRIEPDGAIAALLSDPATWAPPTSEVVAAQARRKQAGPMDTAYVIFTSGTTGRPKGVVISHAAAVNTIDDLEQRFGVTAADSVLAVSQHTFDLSVYNVFGLLAAGGCVVVPEGDERADPQSWLDAVITHGVTVWNSVPAQLQLLLDHMRDLGRERGLSDLRLIMLSGDWIPVGQPVQIAAAAPNARAYSLGGATEAAIWSILHPLDARTYLRSVPYGTAMRNQSVRVLTHRGELAVPWQIGEITIGGAGLATGYLGDSERTAQAFITHPVSQERLYRTGDYGRTDEAGVIELMGRRDNQIKIRGHRIELADIESALDRLDGVAAAVACVVGDRDRPTLTAVVTPAPADATELARRRVIEDAVAETAAIAHRSLTADLPTEGLVAFAAAAKTAALHSMTAALAPALPPGQRSSFDELARDLKVSDDLHRLLRRWIAVLVDEGMARRGGDGIELLEHHDLDRCVGEWAHVRELAANIGYGDELIAYVGRCIAELPRLLTGAADPLTLLFPAGSTDIATAAYRDNLLSRYANGMVVAQVVEYVRHHVGDQPLRILEVGAGVGGTSAELVPALRGLPVRYTFSDVSQFFQNAGRELLADHDFVDYRLFDLNTDPARQGLFDSSFDLIVCANVLHNAEHIEECLARLDRLLLPGGALVFLDSTGVNHPLMISMEFKDGLGGHRDLRADGDSPFLTFDQWGQVLERSPFGAIHAFPPRGHSLEPFGQHVFWCAKQAPTRALRPAGLLTAVRELLPSAMLPQQLRVVSALPLTGNGKIDRARVREDMERFVTAVRADAATTSDGGELTAVQTRIAEIWASVLGLTDVGALSPRSDFFDLGGDSLLLAQSIGRIRQEIESAADRTWDELLRAMVTDPTLAGAERAVCGSDGSRVGVDNETAATSVSPLVRIGAGSVTDGANRPIVVLVHDGSGGLAPYAELIDALTRTQTTPDLYGVRRIPGDDYARIPPQDLFTTLAVGYGRAIAEIAPARVHLVGYCMGALLATEIARYLEEAGIPVGGVTAISSYRVPVEIDDEDVLDYCFAQIMGVRAAELGLVSADADFVDAFARARADHPRVIPAGTLRRISPPLARDLATAPEPGAPRLRLLAESGVLGRDWSAESLAELRSVFAHSIRAVARGAREPFLGDVHFLRQRGDIHFLPTLKEDMTDFWREHCLGELTITDIDGNHFDCLTGANAVAVARVLAASWQEVAGR